MADLLPYLVTQSSQESFHSTGETFQDASPKQDRPPPPDRQPPPSTSTTKNKQEDSTIAALQAAGLSVQDVNTYLNDPENADLLASTKKRKGTASSSSTTTHPTITPHVSTTTTVPIPEPVQLGNPKTSHHVTQLNHLCQERGLRPIFEFAEPAPMRFTTVLRFGESVISPGGGGEGEVTFGSKREAKEAVAAKGVEVLSDVPVPGGGAGAAAEENWVGKLAELYTTAEGPVYTDYALGTNFACECVIPRRPDAPFGARTRPFPNKKAAKMSAAREAVLWLVESGEMSRTAEGTYVVSNNGSGKKKKGKSGAGMTAIVAAESEGTGTGTGADSGNGGGGAQVGAAGGAGERKEASFAARVNDLCPILGLSAPEYRLAQSPQAPSMYSGAAHFVHNPLVNNNTPVGEVRLVFGKKNAKEACAEKVLLFLKGVARERGARDL